MSVDFNFVVILCVIIFFGKVVCGILCVCCLCGIGFVFSDVLWFDIEVGGWGGVCVVFGLDLMRGGGGVWMVVWDWCW